MLDDQIDALLTIRTAAATHLAVWATLQEEGNRWEARQAMGRFRDFFLPTVVAHFKGMVVACFLLLDDRRDAVCIPGVVRRIEQAGQPDIDDDETIAQIHGMRDTWEEVRKIRHKSVSHFDSDIGQKELFARVGLTTVELDAYLLSAGSLVDRIIRFRPRRYGTFDMAKSARETTLSLLRLIEDDTFERRTP